MTHQRRFSAFVSLIDGSVLICLYYCTAPTDLSRAEGRHRKSQEAYSATLARAKDAEKRLRTETGERERVSAELTMLLEVKALSIWRCRWGLACRWGLVDLGGALSPGEDTMADAACCVPGVQESWHGKHVRAETRGCDANVAV